MSELKSFKIRDGKMGNWEKGLANNQDPYGYGVYRYAANWASMMEPLIADGVPLAACAKDTSHRADDEGITGFMYGCAVAVLADVWEHGEELRRWHNKDAQLCTEGDEANDKGTVLNPALLVVGKPQG